MRGTSNIKVTSIIVLIPMLLLLFLLTPPPAHAEIRDISSALHVLPPLEKTTGVMQEFDPTLIGFLKVEVYAPDAPGGSMEPISVFTSQGRERGMDYLRLQNSHYHVNWKVTKANIGNDFEIHFFIKDLKIGFVEYAPSAPRTVPIKFVIDKHPLIRAIVLEANGKTAMEVAGALFFEFKLSAAEVVSVLFVAEYPLNEIVLALVEFFGVEPQECAEILKVAGQSANAIGQVLKEVFSLDALTTAGILKELDFSASEVFDMLTQSYGIDVAEARGILTALGFTAEQIFGATVELLVEEFAPQLRFDSGGQACSGPDTFPMSAQDYYEEIIKTEIYKSSHSEVSNGDSNTVEYDLVPTYWMAFRYGNQIRIVYWWFYGYQYPCDCVSGSHNGDWEHVMVILSEDTTRIGAVVFYQHSGWYTRLPQRDGISFYEQTHPVVRVGRASHGSYHNKQTVFQTCCYWEDKRNDWGPWMNTWNNLVRLRPALEGGEEWMSADISSWGYAGIGNNPMTYDESDFHIVKTCKGTPTWGCHTSGCFRSQCEVGDRDDGITCWHCASGYIDWGLFCVKDCGWYPFCSSHSISTYGVKYTIPLTDKGLLYKNPGW